MKLTERQKAEKKARLDRRNKGHKWRIVFRKEWKSQCESMREIGKRPPDHMCRRICKNCGYSLPYGSHFPQGDRCEDRIINQVMKT